MRAAVLFGLALGLYAADPAEFFESKVRPVLANNCYTCHTASLMGGLRIDSRQTILKGGKSGPAIVPGDPDKSLLIAAISHTHERLKMPPGGKLRDDQIAAIRQWIRDGAVWPEAAPNAAPKSNEYVITPEQRSFWSFQPVGKPAPGTTIDALIRAKLDEHGLKPVRQADKRTLIRRATFDLIGLPPTPREIDAFLADNSQDAFARVIDRLLASPHYGERWGRYWLDVARYSDDRLNSTMDSPYENAWRYRDWVVRAFNEDMPYDLFVKAQIAGDLIVGDRARLLPGLGFYGLNPEFQDDRVDATTRGFLGLTVACAQCHDHKFDPIPAKDYYSLLGIFNNSKYYEYPLASTDVVSAWQKASRKIEAREKELKEFVEAQTTQLADILVQRTADYMLAARGLAPAAGLDPDTLSAWKRYLAKPAKEHPYLKCWFDLVEYNGSPRQFRRAAGEFQELVLAINEKKKKIDDENHVRLGTNPDRRDLSNANLLSLERDEYVLWRDLFENRGIYNHSSDLDCYLGGYFKDHLADLRADISAMKKALPPKYPFLHGIEEASKITKQRVYLRGSRENLGDEVAPHFLSVLSPGASAAFTNGSGRLELANAIAGARNPLTARVIVNRIWRHHFGQGIVRTPSNFGQLGDRPSHPELLDYLASRLVENRWSIKSLHREIMLSEAYQRADDHSVGNYAIDPENRYLWRANRQRLDIEALRDSLLFVSGNLDLTIGGPAQPLDENNRRRTIYGFVSRRKLNGLLALFDFPNPNNTSEQRMVTNVPLQRLFFMNSPLVIQEARTLAHLLEKEPDDRTRIRRAYRLLLGRDATPEETKLGLDFLRDNDRSWPRYAQVLLSSNEFGFQP